MHGYLLDLIALALMAPGIFPHSLNHLFGFGAGVLLGVIALSQGALMAIPTGPLNKSNKQLLTPNSYQESRLGLGYNNKPCSLSRSQQNSSFSDTNLSERPFSTVPAQQ
jgi:hypothetical protein